MNRKFVGKNSRHMGNIGPGHIIHLAAASRLVGCVGCIRAQERAPAYRSSPGPLLHDPPTTMSTAPSAATPTSQSAGNFVSIFNAALESYRRKTKKDLVSHPLLPSLQSCESPEGVLAVLREQVVTSAFLSQSRIGDDDRSEEHTSELQSP